jgi:murein DD-endopeptidase MepM/ murein hydrolase activator NlpD
MACALSTAVTAVVAVTATPPAGAGPAPSPAASPGSGGLPSLLTPILPALPVPVPTRLPALPALPLPPLVKPPAPPATQTSPGSPAGPATESGGSTNPQPAPQPAGPAPGAGAVDAGPPGVTMTRDSGAGIIANDPGASLYPQVPVDPATTPQDRLVARLGDVQRREQYLQNILIRTKSDLAVTQDEFGPVIPLITQLTAPGVPATPAGTYQGAVNTAEGRMLALSSAIASGQAELTRLQSDEQSLQQQVNSGIAQAMTAAAPAPATPATYVGGKLLRPVSGAFTSPFGNRFDPYYHVWQLHAGLDIGAPTGTSIVAAAPGRVTQAGWSGGYGNYTCIDHGVVNGQRVSTCYAHQQKILVSPGQQVSAGQVIGQVGSTGASTGPHLHFEVRLGGRAVDPMPWL